MIGKSASLIIILNVFRFHNIKYGFLRILGKLFLSVGYLIASFPYVFIIFTLLLSMISYGVIYLRFAPRLQVYPERKILTNL